MNFKNDSFNRKKETIVGDYGEQLVTKVLEEKGSFVYHHPGHVSHPFDKIVLSKDDLFFLEVKTKPRLLKYTRTGFNTKHYNDYISSACRFSVRLYICFVDYEYGWIYGEWLSNLKPHSENSIIRGITTFPLDKMKMISKISDKDLVELKKGCNSKYR